ILRIRPSSVQVPASPRTPRASRRTRGRRSILHLPCRGGRGSPVRISRNAPSANNLPGIDPHATEPAMPASTRVSTIIHAPRAVVYQAFIDPEALAAWRAPDGMRARVHEFDAREGGSYRMSLTYTDPGRSPGGKSSDDTDTFQGRFAEIVPNEKIVELIEFESPDPRFAGVMKMTTRFADAGDGTEVTLVCDDIPPGIRPEDNELGCRLSLQNLA